MTPKDIQRLRENLALIKRWVHHWRLSAELNLPITVDGLDHVEYMVKDSLRYLPEDSTIVPGDIVKSEAA